MRPGGKPLTFAGNRKALAGLSRIAPFIVSASPAPLTADTRSQRVPHRECLRQDNDLLKADADRRRRWRRDGSSRVA